jgi:hypothetical protein
MKGIAMQETIEEYETAVEGIILRGTVTSWRDDRGSAWAVIETNRGIYRGGDARGDAHSAIQAAGDQLRGQFYDWFRSTGCAYEASKRV